MQTRRPESECAAPAPRAIEHKSARCSLTGEAYGTRMCGFMFNCTSSAGQSTLAQAVAVLDRGNTFSLSLLPATGHCGQGGS